MALPVPTERETAARQIATLLQRDKRATLITHVNADGDGLGSEVALWHLLTAQGLRPLITNPTPIPERYDFLLPREIGRASCRERV